MHHDPKLPTVAPYDACIACFRGDTATAVGVRGEAEWAIAFLAVLGVPSDQAVATVQQRFGGPPGTVPAGTIEMAFRVCRDCAAKGGVPVARVGTEAAIPVVEPR